MIRRITTVLAIAISGFLTASLRADIDYVTNVVSFGIATRSLDPYVGVGLKFRNNSGHDLVITQLGRWVIAGNKQIHTLSLYAPDGTQLASVDVNCSGATPGQFLYGELPAPCIVAPGQIVYVMSSEIHGGTNDEWYHNVNTVLATTTVVGNEQSAYRRADGTFRDAGGGNPPLSAGPVTFRYSAPIPGWTKVGNVYTTDGDQYSVFDALTVATPGDIITVPEGNFTWASQGSPIIVGKPVTLIGQGPDKTTINIPTDAVTGPGGNIRITASAVVGRFKVKCVLPNTTVFNATTVGGWRITDIVYDSANTTGSTGYFLFASSYGLIDNCVINGAGGPEEWIFTRGPTNSWQTPSSMGTENALYVENCTFNNQGYMDFNSNARSVVRYCTFNATANMIKVDSHGYTSNTPARSARQTEVYGNIWQPGKNLTAIELRGGTGMVFDNINTNTGGMMFVDYGYQTNLSNYGRYVAPGDYPLIDQIGVGMDPKVGGSEPLYAWNNFRPAAPALWPRISAGTGTASSYTTNSAGYPIGTTTITLVALNTQGSGNGKLGVGDAVAFAGDSNRYLVTAGVANNATLPVTVTIAAPGLLQAIPAAATTMTSGPQTLHQQQTGNPTATFTESDIIKADRDFFIQGASFDGSSGVGRGTKVQMNAIVPSKIGVGFWVTDEGSWNQSFSGEQAATAIAAGDLCEIVTVGSTDFTAMGAGSNAVGVIFMATAAGSGTGTVKPAQGQFYVWNGVAWTLKYTPYTYPHPLRLPPLPGVAKLKETGT